MKKGGCLMVFCLLCMSWSNAQVFIKEGSIEYVVKTDIKKNMWSGSFADQITENLPQLKTGYFMLTFANGKSIFRFDHWDPSQRLPTFMTSPDEQEIWYTDLTHQTYEMQKDISETNVVVADSVAQLKWRITNDTRVIAGFNCRKAFTVIFDSVYVFAFYTDQIMFSGGPCRLHGLPGVILGMTIPRLYKSWIATRVMVNDVNTSVIHPIESRKKYDLGFLKTTYINSTKDWYSDDPDQNKQIQQQKARDLWNLML